MSDSPLFAFSSLSFERDDIPLFADVTDQLNAGDILQVEGPNGSGKTTLLRILAGSLTQTSGEIFWRQQLVSRVRQDYLRDILFVGHQPAVKLELSPLENLRFWRKVMDCDSETKDLEALSAMRLAGYEDVPSYSLSAGQLRRVALARLLISRAAIWLLDEPFTAIDKQGVAELSALLSNHAAKGGMVLLSTHQPLELPNLRRLNLAASKGCSA